MKERIKNLRKALGLKQVDLASAIGVSNGNVGDWERGKAKPGADALAAIVKSFDVSALWLLTGEGEMLNEKKDHKQDPQAELTLEQKELLMLFDHLSDAKKDVVKDFILYQLERPQIGENSSPSPHKERGKSGDVIA